MIEISTQKATILIVDLPEGATAWINESYHTNTMWYKSEYMRNPKHIDLPTGEWEILGSTFDLTEEQWQNVIPKFGGKLFDYDPKEYNSYPDYALIDHPFHSKFFDTATESGLSLLSANKVYKVNPLGRQPTFNIVGLSGGSRKGQRLARMAWIDWQEAQSRVLSNPITLIKR